MSECHNCKKELFRCQCIVDDNGKLQHPKDACKEWVNQVQRWGRHGSLNSESANELTAFIQSQQEEIERLRVFGEWKTGIPITSGIYWCQIRSEKGHIYGRALKYGGYDYVPMEDNPEKVKELINDWETYDEEEHIVYGTGWYEEIEQWQCEFDYVTKPYGAKETILKYCELPDPRATSTGE